MDFSKIASYSFDIQFLSHYFSGDKVYYKILLYTKEDDNIKLEFCERYSELRELHEKLKKDIKNKKNYPEFPPKKLIGNSEEKFLRHRQSSLQSYFRSILESSEFSQSKPVKLWIIDNFKKHYKLNNNNKDGLINKNSIDESNHKSILDGNNNKNNTANNLNKNIVVNSNTNICDNSDKNNNLSRQGKIKNLIKISADIIDNYYKQFIDLSEETHQIIGDEEIILKEKKYGNIITDLKLKSNLFDIPKGEDTNFNTLGVNTENLDTVKNEMKNKLDHIIKYMKSGIIEKFTLENIVTNLI